MGISEPDAANGRTPEARAHEVEARAHEAEAWAVVDDIIAELVSAAEIDPGLAEELREEHAQELARRSAGDAPHVSEVFEELSQATPWVQEGEAVDRSQRRRRFHGSP